MNWNSGIVYYLYIMQYFIYHSYIGKDSFQINYILLKLNPPTWAWGIDTTHGITKRNGTKLPQGLKVKVNIFPFTAWCLKLVHPKNFPQFSGRNPYFLFSQQNVSWNTFEFINIYCTFISQSSKSKKKSSKSSLVPSATEPESGEKSCNKFINSVLRKPRPNTQNLQELQDAVRSCSQSPPSLPLSHCSFWWYAFLVCVHSSYTQCHFWFCSKYMFV